ncbi:hypothetical protein ACJ73_04767 [Blastomyces percursus]|uniref:Uncharacterized protein n=1 Tax=Blastomyces percursus TaxID=1658174 RepID=A0A1J9QUG2_9EURO|nr:hypothetical protein ACJ73_04767 [Blastomyces percursus]
MPYPHHDRKINFLAFLHLINYRLTKLQITIVPKSHIEVVYVSPFAHPFDSCNLCTLPADGIAPTGKSKDRAPEHKSTRFARRGLRRMSRTFAMSVKVVSAGFGGSAAWSVANKPAFFAPEGADPRSVEA